MWKIWKFSKKEGVIVEYDRTFQVEMWGWRKAEGYERCGTCENTMLDKLSNMWVCANTNRTYRDKVAFDFNKVCNCYKAS